MSRHAFLSGFVKGASNLGCSDEQIVSLWKASCEQEDFKETYEKLSIDKESCLEPDQYEAISYITECLKSNDKQAAIKEKLSELLKCE